MKKIPSFRRSKSHEPSGQFTLPRQPKGKVDHSSYHHATVPRAAPSGNSKQRPSLSNLNFGNEEIRKSIDALDQILDEFDDESGISQGSESGISQGSDESLRNRNHGNDTATQAARMIAAQLADGRGSMRLKKTKFSRHLEDDDLPPPPPELLQPHARPPVSPAAEMLQHTIRPSMLNVQKAAPSSPPVNKDRGRINEAERLVDLNHNLETHIEDRTQPE